MLISLPAALRLEVPLRAIYIHRLVRSTLYAAEPGPTVHVCTRMRCRYSKACIKAGGKEQGAVRTGRTFPGGGGGVRGGWPAGTARALSPGSGSGAGGGTFVGNSGAGTRT